MEDKKLEKRVKYIIGKCLVDDEVLNRLQYIITDKVDSAVKQILSQRIVISLKPEWEKTKE